MKYFLTFCFLLCVYCMSAQNGKITNYSDWRIPEKMKEKIDGITVGSFENFSAKGNAVQQYQESSAKLVYDVEFSDGAIVGTIKVLKAGTNKVVASFDVKLPFVYCCGHSPRHCSKTKEEIKSNQEKYQCSGWHRAEVQ